MAMAQILSLKAVKEFTSSQLLPNFHSPFFTSQTYSPPLKCVGFSLMFFFSLQNADKIQWAWINFMLRVGRFLIYNFERRQSYWNKRILSLTHDHNIHQLTKIYFSTRLGTKLLIAILSPGVFTLSTFSRTRTYFQTTKQNAS